MPKDKDPHSRRKDTRDHDDEPRGSFWPRGRAGLSPSDSHGSRRTDIKHGKKPPKGPPKT